jgi:hypothetical protein
MPDAYAEVIAEHSRVDVRTELPDPATRETDDPFLPVQTGAD